MARHTDADDEALIAAVESGRLGFGDEIRVDYVSTHDSKQSLTGRVTDTTHVEQGDNMGTDEHPRFVSILRTLPRPDRFLIPRND